MIYTRQQVQENLRNRDGKPVFYLGEQDRLTDEARDYLVQRQIPILSAQQAKPERYHLLSGGYVTEKPEYMTHLQADVLVPKTHPRILFRGAMDTLEAALLLCQLTVPSLKAPLQEILGLARALIRCDVLNEPVGPFTLCGLTEQQQRHHSHFPQKYYSIPHFMPAVEDGQVILQLNWARCLARQAELAAVNAFSDRDGVPTRVDIVQALNRISSMLYILMLRQKAGSL